MTDNSGAGEARHLPPGRPNGPDVNGMRMARVGRLRSFYLLPTMTNGPEFSEMRTERGGATKVLPLTPCNAKWPRCQRDEHGGGWGN